MLAKVLFQDNLFFVLLIYIYTKICSDKNKPNGQFHLPFDRDAILSFVRELPIRKVGALTSKVSLQVTKPCRYLALAESPSDCSMPSE